MRNQLQTFVDSITNFLPDLIGALLVLLVGWLIAKGIKALVVKLLKRTHWDEKLLRKTNVGDSNVFIANIFYYIIT